VARDSKTATIHTTQELTSYEYECRKNAFKSAKYGAFGGLRLTIQACAMYPLTFDTFQQQRRLVPHLYEYTHRYMFRSP
jgi:hypothetical protein